MLFGAAGWDAMRMMILHTLLRALFCVALPVLAAACTGVYCSEHTRRDLARDMPAPAAPPVGAAARCDLEQSVGARAGQ